MRERWLTVEEVARRLRVSGQTVRRWIRRFKLPVQFRPRRSTLDAVATIPLSSIERLLKVRLDDKRELVNLREAARELGVSERTVRYWLAKGAPHYRIGKGRFLFMVAELKKWRERCLRRHGLG